jgi:predicted helicase
MIEQRVGELKSCSEEDALALFHETRDRKARPARDAEWTPAAIQDVVYRPLDPRVLYGRREFVDFPRPDLQSAWGASNVAIYALPSGTGAGPAVWLHGLLPDYHSFRGSYGGYAFPLWDRRHGARAHNLHPALLGNLTSAYGRPIHLNNIFDAIAGLLSASSYTRRFAWDLEETFAHIPFPAEADVFLEAARIGAEIRMLETFAREPASRYRSARLAGRATGVTLAVPPIGRAFLEDGRGAGTVALQDDQSLRISNLPERVWQFGVSGYRVLPRWLAARNGEALDAPLQRAILDVAWRIEELLHWFDAADQVLASAIATSLSRADLGLPEPGAMLVHGIESQDDEPTDSTG